MIINQPAQLLLSWRALPGACESLAQKPDLSFGYDETIGPSFTRAPYEREHQEESRTEGGGNGTEVHRSHLIRHDSFDTGP